MTDDKKTKSDYKICAETFETKKLTPLMSDLTEEIKRDASLLLINFNRIPATADKHEASRLKAIAMTRLEEAVMWAVKSCSRI